MGKKLQENIQTNIKYKYEKKESITNAILEGNMTLKLCRPVKIQAWR